MQNPTRPNYSRSFAVVTSLFFMWGFITVLVDSLIPRLREIFELSYFQAGLVQFAFFMAYGLLSIPSGFVLARIGYKRGMLLGLATMGIGCLLFWPAAQLRVFELFMVGYFVLAGGMTLLQVAANPYVSVLGDPRNASSRLNLSQAFNSVGTTLAPVVGAMFILSDNILGGAEIAALSEAEKLKYYASEASAVQGPFVVLACALLLLAGLVAVAKLPKVLDTEHAGSYREALKNKRLLLGAIGIFVYVGAEVAIGSYLVNYFLDMNMPEVIKRNGFLSRVASSILHADLTVVDAKAVVGAFVMFYWGGAMVGRFIGAILTRILRPGLVLAAFAIGAVSLLAISMTTSGVVAMVSILCVGLFNSIMFPTIFTLAIEELNELKPQGSGILCTAIVGGAVIPPLYGYFTDAVGFKLAMLLLTVCYGYILFYGIRFKRPSVAA
ncbi:MAG: glucose/galactose MFS transporter [Flavobacteriales bacterium]|nr:glucose/galactose MFS transporter [Flavobacteriales bacterium]